MNAIKCTIIIMGVTAGHSSHPRLYLFILHDKVNISVLMRQRKANIKTMSCISNESNILFLLSPLFMSSLMVFELHLDVTPHLLRKTN